VLTNQDKRQQPLLYYVVASLERVRDEMMELGMGMDSDLYELSNDLEDLEDDAGNGTKKHDAGANNITCTTGNRRSSRSSTVRKNNQPPSCNGGAYRAAIRKPLGAGKRRPRPRRTRTRGSTTVAEVTSSEKTTEEFYVSKRIDANLQHDRMADTDRYEWDDGPRQLLQKELQASHDNMREIDYSVKDGMLLVHKTCRSITQKRCTNPRLRLELHRLAAETVMAECVKISMRIQSNVLRDWMSIVKEEVRTEKLRREQSLRHLEACVNQMTRKRLAWACLCWIDEMERQREVVRISAATLVQSQWRIKRAVDKTQELRTKKWHWAVATVQRASRGRLARVVFQTMMRQRVNAALILQRSIRCRSARLMLERNKMERKREGCAIVLQRAARGQSGRRAALQALEERHRRAAAVHIQRISRARRDHNLVKKRETELKRNSAAKAVQKHVRRRHDTKVVAQLKKKSDEEKREKERSILILQRVYRGHQGKLSMKRIIYGQEMEARRRHSCATSIQCIFRGTIAKQKVKRLRRQAKVLMIREARQWAEVWSDDVNAFHYYNKSTNESLKFAPLTGYTTSDGRLSLQDGRVIVDPSLGHKISNGETRKCDECGIKHRALHYCEQCEEVCCDDCVTKTHSEEDITSHNQKPIAGPIQCSVCQKGKETVSSLPWCTACDAPFCSSCWDTCELHRAQGEEGGTRQATTASENGELAALEGNEAALKQAEESLGQVGKPSENAEELEANDQTEHKYCLIDEDDNCNPTSDEEMLVATNSAQSGEVNNK